MDDDTVHAGNEFVGSVFKLKKGVTADSGWIELVGWDFLEVRRRRTARAVTGFGWKDLLRCKENRP